VLQRVAEFGSVLQRVAEFGSVLQRVAEFGSVLQRVAEFGSGQLHGNAAKNSPSVWRSEVGFLLMSQSIMLQRVAECCRVLPSVAVDERGALRRKRRSGC